MSGIAGVYYLDGRPAGEPVLRAMTDVVRHRGPDGIGHWVQGPVGLGHLQLCTTPESLRERQPLVSDDGSYAITCDGRVDNREELIRALRPATPVSEESTDVELILRAYMVWNTDCVKHITGDFAFAIWDGRRQQLFCARDPLGIRPFHYYFDGSRLIFGTEIKQLFQHPEVPRALDEQMLGLFLCSSFGDGDQTFYKGIRRLRGSHQLLVSARGLALSRYWAPDPADRIRLGSDQEYGEEFLRLFREAVRSRLRGIPPIALKLSGGLDSGSVAVVAGELRREDPALCRDFRAYSYDFGDYQGVDAPELVTSVAASSGTPISWIDVSGTWGLQGTGTGLNMDEPFQLPFDALQRLALTRLQSDGVRVLLTGDGGDDLLSVGALLHLQDWVRSLRWGAAWREFWGTRPSSRRRVGRTVFRSLIPRALRSMQSSWTQEVPGWITEDFARRTQLRHQLASLQPRSRWASSYDEGLRTELRHMGRSPGMLAGDSFNAEYGIEWRHPFWDARLVEFLVRIPPEQKYRQGVSKFLLRQVMGGLLPEAVRSRVAKSSFLALFERGLRDKEAARLAALLEGSRLEELGVVDGVALREAFRGYRNGRDADRSRLYWAVAAEEWLKVAFPIGSPEAVVAHR